MAFYSIPFKKGDRILTAQAEYASNFIAYLQTSRKIGIKIDVIPNDKHGQVSIEALEKMIDDDVKLRFGLFPQFAAALEKHGIEATVVANSAQIADNLPVCFSIVIFSHHHYKSPAVGVTDLPRQCIKRDKIITSQVVDIDDQPHHRPG